MAKLAPSYMYGTWVWVETVGQYFTVCLCPQKGGNQGALPPGPPLLRRAFSPAAGPPIELALHVTRSLRARYEGHITSSLRGAVT